ncbi:hypothetical protein BDN72DRAFT_823235 [Pluteus cervinus]|uniref:Uncharacterized protein n=1 Tax=Pluteus cervinus TaxID=181527 RepID=A0ACD3AM21_9AGAR|nr:hypothetical protein BDN72DRAFT_823235 [Pluteus cervinus]
MPSFKKVSKEHTSGQSDRGALLNITDISIPTSPIVANSQLRLEILDTSPGGLNSKPHGVHQVQVKPEVKGSEMILSVNKIVSITGTHIIFRVTKPRLFATNLTLLEPELAMEDILRGLLEKPGQEVSVYNINPGNAKVTIRKEPLNVLLQQVVLPQSLLEPLGKAKSAVDLILLLGEPLGDLHPAAKLVVGLLKSTADKLKEQKLCYEKFSDLFKKMAEFLFYFEKMQKLKKFHNVQPVIQDILSHMETTLKAALDSGSKNLFKQFIDFTMASEQADKFSDLSSRFDKLLEQLNIAFQLDMAILQEQTYVIVDQAQVDKMLERLNYVDILPGNQCLENTRTLVLQEMRHWAHKNEHPIFWLCGPAGTGKSTLAATIVLQLQADGILAAFFTCRRDYKALNSPLQLLKNICYRLAAVHKPYGILVAEIIKEDPHFGSGVDTVATLFQKLFEQPLQKLDDKLLKTALVIVIDALDECGSAGERVGIISCLLQLKQHCSWIKVLVTSRKNPEIQQALEGQTQRYEVETSNSYIDVQTFIKTKFFDFGLSEHDISQLITAANGLFIWADTAYKYLEDSLDYEECVQTLLGSQFDDAEKPYDQLHNLYNTVLVSGIGSSTGNIKVFQQIMGAILLAAQPLTISALSKLIKCSEKIIDTFIKKLHAITILDTENKVRILHPSFEEYLTNKANHSQPTYWIDTQAGHEKWLTNCLHTMKERLQFNIYGIQTSFVLNKDLPILQGKKTEQALLDIHYASLFWEYHLFKCNVLNAAQEHSIYAIFSGPKALFWMEILSLHGTVLESLGNIQRLSQLVSFSCNCTNKALNM